MSFGHHLQQAAKAMVAAATADRAVLPVLRERCPHIRRQILRDGRHRGLLACWGRSVNVDENAGQLIVHPAILKGIGRLAGVPMAGRSVHAGLQHTYGYLFSLIVTPYGAKRDRWLATDWKRAFCIARSLLTDRPGQGTLLANATWFLGHIVHRDRPQALRRLERNVPTAAPSLADYPFACLNVSRVVEQVIVRGKTEREVLLITDLVPFLDAGEAGEENTLLIYSINIESEPIRLITAFPVSARVVEEIKGSVPRRRGTVDVRLRYNAYVPELFGRTMKGRRFLA
jgi:hypothetical protein